MIEEVKNIRLNNIRKVNSGDFQGGIFLCLFGVNNIPPHLGIIADGNYYSSSAKGNRVGEDVSAIWRRIKQGNIPTIFIKLSVSIDKQLLRVSFGKFPKLKREETCLLPIKDYLESVNVEAKTASYVFELIPLLRQNKLIEAVFSYALEDDNFELPVYTSKDIENRIVKLQETC